MKRKLKRIIVCGPPHSGKSVFLTNLMRVLPPDSFYLAFAAPDGEWHWSNFGDQDLVSVVRQKGKFTEDFVSSMVDAIRNNQQPLVLVDTGGVMSPENGRIFNVCEGCIILANSEKANDAIPAWREFAAKNGVQVLAEIVSDLHGTDELFPEGEGGKIFGRISGLERGHTIASPVLEAVANRLREVIRSNSELTEGELLCNVNGVTLVGRLGITEKNDPFLGIRPEHLQKSLQLTSAVAKLETVRMWNVRASILACAFAGRLKGNIELYDVSKGYFRIPEAVPAGSGCEDCGVEWEALELPEFTLVKFRPTRFITEEDLPRIYPPAVNTEKPVVIAHDGPPMWLDATVVRGYAKAGVPQVAMFWPVESETGRPHKHLGGKNWKEVYPFAGPVVVVAGPEDKIGDIIPVSFDLLKWGTPVLGKLVSGEIVVDRKDSHISDHPTVFPLLGETLSEIHSGGRESFCEEVRFGHIIGETICVTTSSGDEIIFAQRPNRRGLTRFVKNRQPEATSSVVACFMTNDGMGGAYLLTTAFVGSRAPAEPWDKEWADEKSVQFWNSHALIWGHGEIVEGTETTKCPW